MTSSRLGTEVRRPRILYVQYTTPAAYPPLEHGSRMLVDAGWEALFLGIMEDGAEPLGWPPQPWVSVRHLSPGSSGWRRKLHYAWFVVWVIGWSLRWWPKWIYASEALACPVALLLSLRPGLKVIYHEHDAPQVNARSLVGRAVLWTRRKLAMRAQARVLPNEQRAERFAQTVANRQPTFIAWNCPDREEVAPPREPHPGVGLRVLYAGSIAPSRLPITLLHALALLPQEVRLCVIGYGTTGHREYIRALRDVAQQLGVAQRIQFSEPMPHQEVLVRSQEADVGLVLMPAVSDDGNLQWMPGASNKPFDYLASGLALLVSDQPAWRRMYVDPGYGVACDPADPCSMAGALRWLSEHPTEVRAMGERGRRRITTDWNYQEQYASVLGLLESMRA